MHEWYYDQLHYMMKHVYCNACYDLSYVNVIYAVTQYIPQLRNTYSR